MKESDIATRLMSFLLHFHEARFWSYAWMSSALPEGFAAYLPTDDGAKRNFKDLKDLWEAATFAEGCQSCVGRSIGCHGQSINGF